MTNGEIKKLNRQTLNELKKLDREGKATIAQIALIGSLERELAA